MKNQPFSIVVVSVSAFSCLLMIGFLLVFRGVDDFPWMVGGACLPPLLLAGTSALVSMSRPVHWWFATGSLLIMSLSTLAGLAFWSSRGEMYGLGVFLVVAIQFVATLILLGLVFVALLATRIRRNKTHAAQQATLSGGDS